MPAFAAPSAERSRTMRAVKSTDTSPELAVRRALHGLGLRFRLHAAALPGRPDIVLPSRAVAVFVHGCFWHGHTCARGARTPGANRAYWQAKIARNRARDAANAEALTAMGWRVVVLWECEVRSPPRLLAACRDIKAVAPNRAKGGTAR